MPLDEHAVLDQRFHLRRCPTTGRRLCRYCREPFDHHDRRQEFCNKDCKRKWNQYWQSRGPALAHLMYAYRVDRKEGALSTMCHTFSGFLSDFARKT